MSNDLQIDESARQQVQAFIHELETHYGLSPKDIHIFFEDMKWVHEYRQTLNKWGEWSIRSVVGAIALGMVLAFWEGIKHFMTIKS